MKRLFTSPLFWLILVLLLPLWVFAQPGLPFTHDGTIHVARIANFYQSLSEGNIMPRWAANLNWGYGSPVISFVYPLPSYIASLFHAVGFGLVDSTKLVFVFSYVAAAMAMFLWVSLQWGIWPAITAAILYSFVPYRFVDLYVRGALGEHVAFIFPPLLCWALLRGARFPRQHIASILLLGLSAAGLILSHNAFSVMFLPVVVAYGIYVYSFEAKTRRSFVVSSIGGLAYGFLLSAFFWIPAVVEQKYTLIDIVTKGEFAGRFTPWSWFIYSPWNYGGGDQFTKALGLTAWLAVVGASFAAWKTTRISYRWLVVGALSILFVSFLLMTPASAVVWKEVSLMQKFQFPWRFLSVSIFIAAFLGGAVVSVLPKKYTTLVGALLLLTVALSVSQWHPKEYVHKPESYFTDVYDSTTDSGEASPIWSVRFMEQRAPEYLQIVEGEATWKELERSTTKHVYELTNEKRVRVVENTLYFPGWNISSDGQNLPIEFQDPAYRGLMTFWLEPGTHIVTLEFTDTKLRSLANSVSLVAWGALIVAGIFIWKKKVV